MIFSFTRTANRQYKHQYFITVRGGRGSPCCQYVQIYSQTTKPCSNNSKTFIELMEFFASSKLDHSSILIHYFTHLSGGWDRAIFLLSILVNLFLVYLCSSYQTVSQDREKYCNQHPKHR